MQISNYSYNSANFPDMLREIPKPPASINTIGNLPNGVYVAVVGTRKPSAYGRQVTYQLASGLANAGAVIVSGLALGVDGIAHEAALEAGGKTVAVVAHGLDQIYPASHRGLAKRILATGGAIVSEYDLGTPPMPYNFVERNRLIAGLSSGVIVTEAAVKSGSLITARDAIAAGRTLMAVPGPITSVLSAGPNNLIRQGAVPITDTSDAVVALGFHAQATTTEPVRNAREATIVELIQAGKASSDELIAESGFSAAEFAGLITLMEITGKVRNLGAGMWAVR